MGFTFPIALYSVILWDGNITFFCLESFAKSVIDFRVDLVASPCFGVPIMPIEWLLTPFDARGGCKGNDCDGGAHRSSVTRRVLAAGSSDGSTHLLNRNLQYSRSYRISFFIVAVFC